MFCLQDHQRQEAEGLRNDHHLLAFELDVACAPLLDPGDPGEGQEDLAQDFFLLFYKFFLKKIFNTFMQNVILWKGKLQEAFAFCGKLPGARLHFNLYLFNRNTEWFPLEVKK